MAETVRGSGNPNAKVWIIGDTPGQIDFEHGKAFSGPDGQLLKQVLNGLGISWSRDVYATHLFPWRAPNNSLAGMFAKGTTKVIPSSMRIVESLQAIAAQCNAAKPNLIVALGDYALWATTTKAKGLRGLPCGISDWRGSVTLGNSLFEHRKVLVAQKPSYIQRMYKDMPLFASDLGKIKREMEFPELRRIPREVIIDIKGHERELEIQRLLDSPNPIAFDIEYIPSTDRWICISFSNSRNRAVSWRISGGGDVDDARRVLTSGKKLVAQNGMFDCSMLEHWYGINCMPYLWFDTMLASHSAYIELPKDLGTLCSLYTDQECYWTGLQPGHWKLANLDPSEDWYQNTMLYNAIDAYVTYEVMEEMAKDELQDEHTRKTFDFEMALVNPLWDMGKRGVAIDMKAMDNLRTSLQDEETMHTDAITKLVGHAVNVKSGPQVANLLFGETSQYMLPTHEYTPSGSAATHDAAMVRALRDAPETVREIIGHIRGSRECKDLKAKFLNIKLDADKRIRCHYNPGGTVTGRLASRRFMPTGSGGNLQNIPRDDRIRRLFVPDAGYTFFYNDLKSAESHVVAYLTGDPLMIEMHQPGSKPHEITAAALFNMDVALVGKKSPERYLAKQSRHAFNYMQGWKTFMDNINADAPETGFHIDARKSKQLRTGYLNLHPFLETWWRRIELQLLSTRTLHNLLGRPRKFFDRLNASLPRAVAYIPQSTIADVLNHGLVRVAQDEELRDYGLQVLMQVHDAIGGQVQTEYIQPAMKRFSEIVTQPLYSDTMDQWFTVPIEIAVGPNWADVEEVQV